MADVSVTDKMWRGTTGRSPGVEAFNREGEAGLHKYIVYESHRFPFSVLVLFLPVVSLAPLPRLANSPRCLPSALNQPTINPQLFAFVVDEGKLE
jgi:hypothetical protein